jgi:hypothetical protein
MSQTLSVQTFGDFATELVDSREYLTIVFSSSSVPLGERWRTHRLSATFLADYFSTFFPGDDQPAGMRDPKSELMSIITFIANELLENAMKFSDTVLGEAVSLTVQLFPNTLVLLTKNHVNSQTEQKLKGFIQTLLSSDPMELYIQQIEQTAADQASAASGLGILTIINDYGAEVGWQFEPRAEAAIVTTKIQLAI